MKTKVEARKSENQVMAERTDECEVEEEEEHTLVEEMDGGKACKKTAASFEEDDDDDEGGETEPEEESHCPTLFMGQALQGKRSQLEMVAASPNFWKTNSSVRKRHRLDSFEAKREQNVDVTTAFFSDYDDD